jgi:competence protein ComEC
MILSRIFLHGCLAFLAGVGVASLVHASSFLVSGAALIAAFLFFAGIIVKKPKLAVAGILLAGFVFGFWRFDSAWLGGLNRGLARLNGQTVAVSGVIVNDPASNGASRQLIVKPDGITGKILILARPYPEYGYGDRVEFTAPLEEPQSFSGFDYKDYLAKDGIYSMARYPEINLVSTGRGNPVYAGLIWIKHKLMDGISRSLPAPQNSLLVAILFGDQSGLSGCSAKELAADPDCAKLKEKLNISGLRHLAAVSGTHITIMAGIIAPFLIALGWWRQKALWATLAFIWCFILMIGLPASAVRAGIMGSLMILAQILGRPSDILRVVAIAATFMVWQNPLVLRFDIGFQLSFLAVLGMACFAKPLESKIKTIVPKPEFLYQGLAITLAAQIFTLPILIYNFGYVSPYAPISNILVEPVVPFITIYGFVLAIAAAFSFILGWLLFFPLWLALSYLLAVTAIFSVIPGAKFEFQINFIWLGLLYLALAAIACRIKLKEKLAFLD